MTTHPFRRFFGDVCFDTTILYGKACCQMVCLRPGMAHDDRLNMCALFLHVILWGGATCPVYVLPLADNAVLESQVRRPIRFVSHRYRPSEFACCTYAAKARTAPLCRACVAQPPERGLCTVTASVTQKLVCRREMRLQRPSRSKCTIYYKD